MGTYRVQIEAATKPLIEAGWTVENLREVLEAFGDTELILAQGGIKVRFLSDRGQYFADVAKMQGASGWYDLKDVVRVAGQEVEAGPFANPREAVELLTRSLESVQALLENPNSLMGLPVR
jgi:hypothetical protein